MTEFFAIRAADFVESIGVNAHIQQTTSSYAQSDVVAQMAYLGLDNMRVSDAVGSQMAKYQALGKAGIKFDLVTVIAPQNPINLATELAAIDSLAPYTISVEGPNEINTVPVTYGSLTGAAAAIAFQKDLYTAVHADPLLQQVKVLPFSLSVGGNLGGAGNVSAYADEANVHGYASDGVPPYYMLDYAISSVATVTGKPVVMTETGYYTLPNGTSGVNQDVQAKWLMDTLLQNYAHGVTKTYIYQLEDGGSSATDPEQNYGLYTADGTPKQAAVDIHNLTTILADAGPAAASFTPGTLNATITGLHPDYGFSEVVAKSDGRYDVAFWSEPNFFNAATGVEKAVTPRVVTLSFDKAYNVSVFDPVIGTTAITTYRNVTSVAVSLATDPLIVELTPITRSQSTVASLTLAPLGTASGSLTLDNCDWTSTGNVIIGDTGSASLIVQNGAVATVGGSLVAAHYARSSGTVSIDATSTLRVAQNATVGFYVAGSTGMAAMSVAGSLQVGQKLAVNTGSTLTLAGGTVAAAGTITVAAKASIRGYGLLSSGIGSPIVDRGTITAAGGTLEINGSLSSGGVLAIASDGTAKIDGSTINLASIAFLGATGTLSLASNATVNANITGFTAGDSIVMAGVDSASWNTKTGSLVLSHSGNTVSALHLVGNYSGGSCTVQHADIGNIIAFHSN